MRLCKGTCGREVLDVRVWRAIPAEDRKLLREVQSQHAGRGMCGACHVKASRDGSVIDHPRATMPGWLFAEEWAEMADPRRSVVANVRELAPRLGMSEYAVQSAYYKNRRRGLIGVAA